MKQSFVAIITTAALVMFGQAAVAQVTGGRIVTVDLKRIFNGYYKTDFCNAKWEEQRVVYKKELDELDAQHRKLNDDLAKLQEDMEKPEYTEEVKAQKRKLVKDKLDEIAAKKNEIQEAGRRHSETLRQTMLRMRAGIIKEIQEVIAKEARDLGYLYVFDKSGETGNLVPAIVYSQDSLDITEDILKVLNKNAPKPAAEPAKAPKTK
ncbi:MAG: OmpH family outer membrane protein [Verrucomicrobia bacterium]|nr:OmpH family outer membrane protein [Verrucomicrobiota bacterium]